MQWSEYTTAERLKILRSGMTQEQLAEAADVSVGASSGSWNAAAPPPFLPCCPSPPPSEPTSPCSSASRHPAAP